MKVDYVVNVDCFLFFLVEPQKPHLLLSTGMKSSITEYMAAGSRPETDVFRTGNILRPFFVTIISFTKL